MAKIWFAQTGSTDVSLVVWTDTYNAVGGSTLIWANLSADDTLVANGQTGLAIGASLTVARLTTAGASYNDINAHAGTNGGGFTTTTASGNITLRIANIGESSNAGTTAVLAATLSATYTLTLNDTVAGNVYGGSGSGCYGLNFGGVAAGKLLIGASGYVTSIYGGLNASAYGLFVNSAAPLPSATWYCNAIAGTALAIACYLNGSTLTYNGNLTSSATAAAALVSSITSQGTFALNGNLIMPSGGSFPLTLGSTALTNKFQWNTGAGGTITLYDSSAASHRMIATSDVVAASHVVPPNYNYLSTIAGAALGTAPTGHGVLGIL